MDNSIDQNTDNTNYSETAVALYKIFLESIYTASSVKEKLTTSSSSAEEYEGQQRLEEAEGGFTSKFVPFIQNEEFVYRIDTKADAFVGRYLKSDSEERLSVSSSLHNDYGNQAQIKKDERKFILFIPNEEFEPRVDTKAEMFIRRYLKSDSEERLSVSSSLHNDYGNQAQIKKDERKFANSLISFIQNEEFEYGIDTKADAFVRRYMGLDPLLTKEWINAIFIDNFADVSVLVGLLRIVARLDYLEIAPQGQTMALAALAHENSEVKECGVRAYESWGTIDSLKELEHLKVGIQWLQEYIDNVVSDLKKEHDVVTHQENK